MSATQRIVRARPVAGAAATAGSEPAALRVERSAVRVERLPALDGVAPMDAAEVLRGLPGLALLESARPGRKARWSFLSADPLVVLEAPAPGRDPFAEARRLVARLDAGAPTAPADDAGRPETAPSAVPPFIGGLMGFLGYDLGHALERLPVVAADDQDLPGLRLALHDWAIAFDRRDGRAWLGGRALDGDVERLETRLAEVRARFVGGAGQAAWAMPADPGPTAFAFRSSLSRVAYEAGVEAIRAAIARGDIYQANLTRRLATPFSDDPWPLYRALRTGDPALFAAYLDLGPRRAGAGAGPHRAGTQRADPSRAIVSASPEPFLSVGPGGRVATDPIKGTRPRGATPEEDRALAGELLASAKDRAENVMIVDVLRNDLGRVCRPGTVRVPRLCRLERTAAVQHLVSTVTGRLAPDRDAFDLLAASFPGGSITGAPKIRAMEILESIEPVRRGPYTGAALWLGPDGSMASSILIRTFVADGRRLSLHVGGGITWRSDPAEEWEETVTKARGPLRAIGGVEVE